MKGIPHHLLDVADPKDLLAVVGISQLQNTKKAIYAMAEIIKKVKSQSFAEARDFILMPLLKEQFFHKFRQIQNFAKLYTQNQR